jgi:hypothetical protein
MESICQDQSNLRAVQDPGYIVAAELCDISILVLYSHPARGHTLLENIRMRAHLTQEENKNACILLRN